MKDLRSTLSASAPTTKKRPNSTSMYAEDLVVDDYTQSEEVKHVREVVPDIRVSIFPRAFCIESV